MRSAVKRLRPAQDAVFQAVCTAGWSAGAAGASALQAGTIASIIARRTHPAAQSARRSYAHAPIGFFASAQGNTDASLSDGDKQSDIHMAYSRSSLSRKRDEYALFQDVHSLLLEPQHTLSTLLDAAPSTALDGTCVWPEKLLIEALKRHPDSHSLMRLFPSVELYATQHRDRLPRVGKVLRLYLEAIRQCRALAAVREVTQIWIDVVDSVYEEGGMDGKRWAQVKRLTWELGSVLRSFANPVVYGSKGRCQTGLPVSSGKGKALPANIKQDIESLIRMIYRIGDAREAQLGSTSKDAGNHLDSNLRRIAFSPLVLTPSLRQLLLARIPEHSITTGEWHACMLSAAREGDGALARRFRELKGERQERAREWAERGDLREDVEQAFDDGMVGGVKVFTGTCRDQLGDLASSGSPDSKESWPFDMHEDRWSSHHSPEDMTAIDDIIQSRDTGPTDAADLMAAIEPHLRANSKSADSAITPYAWSILATHTAKHAEVRHDDLLGMIPDMPKSAISPHSITPIMDGLLARGQAKQAWELWEEMSAMHLAQAQASPAAAADNNDDSSASREEARAYVDQALLSSATYACAKYSSLDSAVHLVDSWATRVRPSTSPLSPHHSIQLDTQNLNVLLHLCTRHHRPHLAFRLFTAALPRWGVWPDAISLNLLLDCARFASQEVDSVSARLKALAQSFGFGGGPVSRGGGAAGAEEGDGTYEVYDAAGFAAGPTSVLLDPVKSDGTPDPDSEYKDGLRWYERGKNLMRSVVLGNHPHLSDISNPLHFNALFDSLDDILSRGQVRTCLDRGGIKLKRPRDRAPRVNARYTHIMPDATTFQAYITLLGYYNMPQEIPIALAWAREMGVEPTWRCMCSALAFVCETEGPRRRVKGWYDLPAVEADESAETAPNTDRPAKAKTGSIKKRARLVRDEEILRRWLQDWVRGDVPSEADVAAFISSVRAKGGRMAA